MFDGTTSIGLVGSRVEDCGAAVETDNRENEAIAVCGRRAATVIAGDVDGFSTAIVGGIRARANGERSFVAMAAAAF